MESSSRIFVRGLPPSITEESFRDHFAKRYQVTDVKLFPHRRIGYVGFKTGLDASKAVKYFDKTFIRMSRIRVEMAKAYEHTPDERPTTRKHLSVADNNAEEISKETQGDGTGKRKRDDQLEEYIGLMQPPSKLRSWLDSEVQPMKDMATTQPRSEVPPAEETLVNNSAQGSLSSNPGKRPQSSILHPDKKSRETPKRPKLQDDTAEFVDSTKDKNGERDVATSAAPESDSDWLRSRTSRLLGLLDDDEDAQVEEPSTMILPPESSQNQKNHDVIEDGKTEETAIVDIEMTETGEDSTQDMAVETSIRESRRLFVRNLPFSVEEDDITDLFSPKGEITEVHVPADTAKRVAKGFAYVEFAHANDAVAAWKALDGTIFQGRLLHILPADGKRETKVDGFALSQLPIKKQRELQRKSEAASTVFNWNFMYMNPDAVASSISDSLGVDKSELFDPTSADAAVKQAQAEAHVIQSTKNYFESNGVNLKAFGKRRRSDAIILVKNFQYGTKADDLKGLFEQHGEISRFLMPPSGTIAIVQFVQKHQARAAFASLAYRKYGSSVLFLEKAPENLFEGASASAQATPSGTIARTSTTDLMQGGAEDDDDFETSTIFVKNLSFSTSNESFKQTFEALDGFVSARVKMKSPTLSAGFGFLEFRSKEQARAAIAAVNGYILDGHVLEMKASHKGQDAAEERRKEDIAKRKKMRRSKVIIKNLPFEATKKDVRNLFKSYGELRAVRVPKKFDNTTKGYAFAEFTTPREAESAMEALRHVHFLGRRLNIEFAAGEDADPEKEIERMQQKVGRQSNSVAVQQLKSAGRKKLNVNGPGEEMDA